MPEKITNLVIYFTTGITMFALLSIFDYFNKGSNVFHTAEYMLAPHTLHFSFTYAKINLIRYLAGFMGGPISVAGLDFIILPIGVGMVSLFSMIFNVFIQKNRLINLYLFLSVVCTLVFISAFRIVDGRYVFISIPALIIVFGTTLNWLYLFFKSIKRKYVSYGLLIFSIIGIVSSNYSQVKNELYANFYDSKKPLNYQAILVLNKYFAATSKNPNKQVVITTLSPYIVDFYSNHNYGLLPLSKLQYFTDTPEITWGKNDYSDFVKLYSKYINQGYTLYVSDYKTGPGYFYNIDYQKIQHNFILERVASGCSSQCNLYKLSVKKISQHN